MASAPAFSTRSIGKPAEPKKPSMPARAMAEEMEGGTELYGAFPARSPVLAAILAGGVIVYSFWLILATTSFWLVRVENILVIFQSVYEAGRWPVSIYPGWLRFALTFLVPVAFAITVPAQALAGRLTWQVLLGAAAFAAALFAAARVFWRLGVRHYSGASS